MSVVDGRLSLGLPRCQRRCIVRVDADDIERVQIPELNILKVFEFATKHQVQELFRFAGFGHLFVSFYMSERALHLLDFRVNVNRWTDVKMLSKALEAHILLRRTMPGG